MGLQDLEPDSFRRDLGKAEVGAGNELAHDLVPAQDAAAAPVGDGRLLRVGEAGLGGLDGRELRPVRDPTSTGAGAGTAKSARGRRGRSCASWPAPASPLAGVSAGEIGERRDVLVAAGAGQGQDDGDRRSRATSGGAPLMEAALIEPEVEGVQEAGGDRGRLSHVPAVGRCTWPAARTARFFIIGSVVHDEGVHLREVHAVRDEGRVLAADVAAAPRDLLRRRRSGCAGPAGGSPRSAV